MAAINALQKIVDVAQTKGVKHLPSSDVRAFASLYRRVVGELAESRANGLPAAQSQRAEALLIRAHAILYAPEPVHVGESALELFTSLPAAVFAVRKHLLFAFTLLVIGCAWGYLEVRCDPSSAPTLLPGSSEQNAEESFQANAVHEAGSPVRGMFYFTHNASIALNVYALGGTAGVGTALLVLYNGVNVGASFAVVQNLASPKAFFAFILPHSGIELFAILLAASGGLKMGEALLRPGTRRRRDALSSAARESLPLALGAAALLAIAGLTEGWISPMPWPLGVKAAIGATLDSLLVAYLWLGRRAAMKVFG